MTESEELEICAIWGFVGNIPRNSDIFEILGLVFICYMLFVC